MKKENYGIPTALLNVMIYVMALYVALSNSSVIWTMIALTVAVFALGFSSNVKKTAVQASALVVMVYGAKLVFDFFGYFLSFFKSSDYAGDSIYRSYCNIQDNIFAFFNIAICVIFVLLAILALVKKDVFVAPVHKAVDGFVPRPAVQPQQYNGQPQQYNGQPQQYNGQPQQYNSQPQQYSGQPQQYNGQPQQFAQPQQPQNPQQ